MAEGPERVIFDKPEPKKTFFGRSYFPPPEKVLVMIAAFCFQDPKN